MRHTLWTLAVGAAAFLGGAPPSLAADATGNSALALAALISINSPTPDAAQKDALASALGGRPTGRASIQVLADTVQCRASNVDLTHHVCDITIKGATKSIGGRRAHELYATMVEAGVEPEGAAGSIIAVANKIACQIDMKEIADNDGGGAKCAWDAP